MKFKQVCIAGLCTVLVAMASCKKDNKDDPPQQKTTAQRIQAKWNVDNYILHAHGADIASTGDTSVTFPGATSDYFDFRADSSFYISLFQESDSLTYSLQDDSTVLINNLNMLYGENTTFRIRNLTDNTMTLFTKESDPDSPGGYADLTFNLKK